MLIVHQGEFSSVRQLFAERFNFIGNDAFQFFLWDNQLIIGYTDRLTRRHSHLRKTLFQIHGQSIHDTASVFIL